MIKALFRDAFLACVRSRIYSGRLGCYEPKAAPAELAPRVSLQRAAA
jgi:hypothetical protein